MPRFPPDGCYHQDNADLRQQLEQLASRLAESERALAGRGVGGDGGDGGGGEGGGGGAGGGSGAGGLNLRRLRRAHEELQVERFGGGILWCLSFSSTYFMCR